MYSLIILLKTSFNLHLYFKRYVLAVNMTDNICRICLKTHGVLQELYGNLLDYFQDICNHTSGLKLHLCCLTCKESLQNNLDFINLCVASNNLYQDWERDKSQQKLPITSLQELLQISLNDSKTTEESKVITIKDDITTNDIEITKNYEEFKPITVKELIDSGFNDNGYKVKNNDILNDVNYSDDDDKFLIECVEEKNNINEDKNTDGSYKVQVIQGKRVYPRKGQSWYSQYQTVFDIQLFATDEEARKELLGRRLSEPYISAPHRCEVCYTVYKCDKLLQFHMKWHDPSSSSHACDICNMRFSRQKSLQCHKTHCHRGRFNCKLCPLITYYEAAMKAHFQKHQGKVFKCHCNRVFKHKSTYLTHKRIAHASAHVCVSCARTFLSELGLAHHRVRAHQGSSIPDPSGATRCEPCGLTFATQQVYTVHVMNTDKHKDIADTLTACPECGLQLPDKLQVRAHRRQAHPQYNYYAAKRALRSEAKPRGLISVICPRCGASGNNNMWLYRHFQSAHPAESYERRVRSDKRRHLCDQCGKSFCSLTQLTEHAYTHSGLKPFRCEKCPATFSSKVHLKLHLERHAPASRECTQCGKKFVSASNLSNHMRSHIGDRRYKCSLCAKGFLHCAALREHIRGVHLHIRRQRKTHNK